jgi:hypothetical protein
MFPTKVAEKIKKTHCLINIFFGKSYRVWHNVGEKMVRNSPPLTSTLSHKNPVHTPLHYLFHIHFYILLPPSPRPSTRSLLSGIPIDIPPPCLLSYACCILRLSLSNNIQNKFKILKSSPCAFFSASYHFLLHRSKFSPQHIFRKHSQIILYSQCYRPRYIKQVQL